MFTFFCCAATLFVPLVGLTAALLLGVVANFFYHAGLTTYNALIPTLGKPEEYGKISGIGVAWAVHRSHPGDDPSLRLDGGGRGARNAPAGHVRARARTSVLGCRDRIQLVSCESGIVTRVGPPASKGRGDPFGGDRRSSPYR